MILSSHHRNIMSMFWLNNDRPTGVWKLHKQSCRFCKPKETTNKGLNQMKTGGGWFETESYEAALALFNKNHDFNEYWQPCKECNPET